MAWRTIINRKELKTELSWTLIYMLKFLNEIVNSHFTDSTSVYNLNGSHHNAQTQVTSYLS